MDHTACKEVGQNDYAIETSPAIDKSRIPSTILALKDETCDNQNSDSNIACMTPEKANDYIKGKSKEEAITLQQKCQTLIELFDSLTCSLRLLSLRKKLATFHNICCRVEVMTKRNFSTKYLAQIVYIVPEAVHIDKVIIHDKKTLCMKPEMVISLQFNIVEGHSEHSDFLALRKVFASRLMKYFITHPKKNDVPEGALPKPFNQKNVMGLHDQLSVGYSVESRPSSLETGLNFKERQPRLSFKKYFSQKVVSEAGVLEPVASLVDLSSTTACCLSKEDNNNRLDKGFTDSSKKSDIVLSEGIKNEVKKDSPCRTTSAALNPAAWPISPQFSANSSESPLVKSVISSPSMMIQTPTQSIPKRSIPKSDVKIRIITSTEGSCKPTKRSLNFSSDENVTDNFFGDEMVTENFSFHGHTTGSLTASHKEEETQYFLNEQLHNNHISTAICQEPSTLPDLVRIIYNIFKSVNCHFITKEELVHKIIMHSLDVTDRKEVEEQLEQLEMLVPDWISKKTLLSGDITFSIAKGDVKSVVAKVVQS